MAKMIVTAAFLCVLATSPLLARQDQASATPSNYLAPGVLYGDASHVGDSAPGGTLNDGARRFEIREDWLSAPLFAMLFRDGGWAAVLDTSPRGDTTWEETTARGPGGVDEYLDWAVPQFAELYEATRDEHDLDVVRILLFDTKNMLALQGRTYDLDGPGWQQENWGMGPGRRGLGSHRGWLPWISVNHLHGITGLEEVDPVLYRQLTKEN